MFRCLMIVVVLTLSAPAQNEGWKKLTARLEQAALDGDAATLKLSRAELLRLQTTPEGKSNTLVAYAIAYVGWRMAFNPDVSGKEQADLLDEAEAQLKAVLKTDPKSAEALALLSGVYGGKIAHSPMKGMTLGPRSTAAIDAAVGLEPANPRVLVSQAIGKFKTPAMFGGSASEAEALIRRALAAFQTEPPDKAWPNWGRFDAYAWLGQLLAKRGDKAGSRAAYEQALAIAPKSGWVRYVLLPALDKGTMIQ